MTMRLNFPVTAVLAAFLSLSVSSELAGEDGSPAEWIISRALENYREWRAFKVDFKQTYVSGMLGSEATEGGIISVKIESGVRWDYLNPERKMAVLKPGGESVFYIPGEKRAYFDRIGEDRIGRLYLALLTGRAEGLDGFEKEVIARFSGRVRVKLRPRDEVEGIDFILVDFDSRGYHIHEITVVDEVGNNQSFLFSGYEKKARIDDRLFDLKLPPNVRIVDRRVERQARDRDEPNIQSE